MEFIREFFLGEIIQIDRLLGVEGYIVTMRWGLGRGPVGNLVQFLQKNFIFYPNNRVFVSRLFFYFFLTRGDVFFSVDVVNIFVGVRWVNFELGFQPE